MEKRNYTTPTVSYVGPDLPECLETNVPVAAAVGASVVTSVAATILSKIW